MSAVLTSPPQSRGRWRQNADLSRSNWFQVGGEADWLFKPADVEDLADALKALPEGVPVFVLGVGSNLILRDGGMEGVVIRLGRGFTTVEFDTVDDQPIVRAGAGMLGKHLAEQSMDQGFAGVEFLSGIPGTVGGAVAMNAGAYGREVKDCLRRVQLVMPDGQIAWVNREDLPMRYRFGGLPEGAIVTAAEFFITPDAREAVAERIDAIQRSREETQPIRERTGGSTFKNPEGKKAWQLVDEAGCRGYRVGGAQMSEKHCNFMINTGDASAADLEALGETVREKVKAVTGITLEWEIKRIGRPRFNAPLPGAQQKESEK